MRCSRHIIVGLTSENVVHVSTRLCYLKTHLLKRTIDFFMRQLTVSGYTLDCLSVKFTHKILELFGQRLTKLLLRAIATWLVQLFLFVHGPLDIYQFNRDV